MHKGAGDYCKAWLAGAWFDATACSTASLPGYSPRNYEGVEPSENGPRNFGRSGPYQSMAARVTCLPCIDTALVQRVTCCYATAQADFD